MNRSLTSLFAAFEALLVVAIGIGISLAPLTVLWGVQYGFAPDWWDFWRASVDIWLVGHGVDLILLLDPATAAGAGFAGAADPFAITIAVLGFALLTVLLGMRAGRRIAQTDFRLMGELVAIGVFAAISYGVTASAQHSFAQPDLVQGIVYPTLVFALGMVIGTLRSKRQGMDALSKAIREWLENWRPSTRFAVASALRGGAAASAAVIAVASVIVALLIFTNYAQIITLYEGLHAGALGGFALTLAQIALLPNLVLWAVSWLVGPGFAIGTGSAVSPLATNLGPIPAVPVLGALPSGDSVWSFVWILVPIIAGFLAGALLRTSTPGETPLLRTILTGLGMGVSAGAILGFLTWAASGSAGPGRLETVGANPWLVALFVALEVGLAASLGLFAASRLPTALASAKSFVTGGPADGPATPAATATPVAPVFAPTARTSDHTDAGAGATNPPTPTPARKRLIPSRGFSMGSLNSLLGRDEASATKSGTKSEASSADDRPTENLSDSLLSLRKPKPSQKKAPLHGDDTDTPPMGITPPSAPRSDR